MTERLRQVWLAVLGVGVLAFSCAGAPDEQDIARLTQEVRRAVAVRTGPSDDAVLFALRGLRDERLRPLFAEMASREDPAVQLHGIFGLADLSQDQKVNIVQLAGLSPKELRALALGRAIGADYLTHEQMRQVLTWPELEPSLELLVNARLRRAGDVPNVDRLRELAMSCTSEQMASRVLAQLIVAQVEDDSEASEAQETIDSADENDQGPLVAFALAQIVMEQLDGLDGFVQNAYEWSQSHPTISLQALATLLITDTELGLQRWREAYGGVSGLSERIRLALVLLDSANHVGPEAYEPLIGDEIELIDLMGQAGRAVAGGEGESDALRRLLDQNHPPSFHWAFDVLGSMEPDRRAEVLRLIIGGAIEERAAGAGVPAFVYEGARELERCEPSATTLFLAQACDASDAALCEALLAAILETDPNTAWDVEVEPRWPNRRSRVLAVIAEARAGHEITSEELDLLVSAGLGGEGLPPAFRVQAAWLALTQLEKEREALAEVLAPGAE